MFQLTLADLDTLARGAAPRLFALYGIYRHRIAPDDDGSFVGWGMDLGAPYGAIMWDLDGATATADSAERMLRTRARIGEAHLIWLTDDPLADTADSDTD